MGHSRGEVPRLPRRGPECCRRYFPRVRPSYSLTPRKETDVPRITRVGRVIVPVSDQDAAIEFYTGTLGFSLAADLPFGDGDRWVEVAPPGGGAALALTRPQGDYKPGRMTGIALESPDPRS